MPLHALAKAAAFLPAELFKKGLEARLWNPVWQLLFAGNLFFVMLALPLAPKFFSAPLKTRHPKSAPPPALKGTLGRWHSVILAVRSR